ncbi:hypothetical protein V6N13_111933 [Hibiscus sabdariffa]
MGSCVSTSAFGITTLKKHRQRSKKSDRKQRKDSASVTDIAVSEYVHKDLEKGATTTCRRSKVCNSSFHLTQLLWHYLAKKIFGLIQSVFWNLNPMTSSSVFTEVKKESIQSFL